MTDQSGSCEYEYISDLHNEKVHQLIRPRSFFTNINFILKIQKTNICSISDSYDCAKYCLDF